MERGKCGKHRWRFSARRSPALHYSPRARLIHRDDCDDRFVLKRVGRRQGVTRINLKNWLLSPRSDIETSSKAPGSSQTMQTPPLKFSLHASSRRRIWIRGQPFQPSSYQADYLLWYRSLSDSEAGSPPRASLFRSPLVTGSSRRRRIRFTLAGKPI